MTDESPVLTERRDGVLLITLNRPDARNAVNLAVAEGIAAALDELDGSEELSVGVLTGAGKGFCAGMDLKAFVSGQRPWVGDRGFAGIVRRSSVKPLIAAIEGFAVAGGLEIALACDLIVAARGAKLGVPEVKRSLVAAGGALLRLPRRIPYHAAMELALTGDPIAAERGRRAGLVNRLAEPGEAVRAALGLAAEIAVNAPLALVASKRILQEQWDWDGRGDVGRARAPSPTRCSCSEDAREGATAFAEKRPPVWRGSRSRPARLSRRGKPGPALSRRCVDCSVARAQPRAFALAFALAHDHHKASPQGAHQRSPGVFFGYCDTGTPRSSAVRTMRLCSVMCAAG